MCARPPYLTPWPAPPQRTLRPTACSDADEPRRCRMLSLERADRAIVKIALAAGLAWWLGNLAGQARPVFAAIAPIVVIRTDTTETFRGSVGRVVGVLVGVGIGLAALTLARPSPLIVGIVVAAALVADRVLARVPRFGVDTRNQ